MVIQVGSPIPGDVLEMEGMAFSFGCHSAWGWYSHLMGGDEAFMVLPCSTCDKPAQWNSPCVSYDFPMALRYLCRENPKIIWAWNITLIFYMNANMFYTVLIYADFSRNATAVYKSRGDLTLFYLELHLRLFTISKNRVTNQCQCPLVAFELSIQYPYISPHL